MMEQSPEEQKAEEKDSQEALEAMVDFFAKIPGDEYSTIDIPTYFPDHGISYFYHAERIEDSFIHVELNKRGEVVYDYRAVMTNREGEIISSLTILSNENNIIFMCKNDDANYDANFFATALEMSQEQLLDDGER